MGRNVRVIWAAGGVAAAFLLGVVLARAATRDLGRVRWGNDLDVARREARDTGRPVMVLSRGRHPAAKAARRFGAGALSHPIVVDAAGEFVPVATAGGGGGDAPAHPAIRFFDGHGKELAPEGAADPSAARLLARMVAALRSANRPVPEYLDLVAAEYNPPRKETATFAVTCYWKGEKELAQLGGVLATRTGTLGKEEVVEVDFDPGAIDYPTLAGRATGMACFRKVYAHTPDQHAAAAKLTSEVEPRADARLDASNQQQFHLSLHPTYHLLPLTGLQATKVNAALVRGEPPERYLSPGQAALQRRMAKRVEKERAALYGLEQSLQPDRSPDGLPAYAAEIERRVGTP